MGLELASQWMLSFFAAVLAGVVVGWLVGRFAPFEVGLGVGLLLPGVVSLAFTARFVAEYRALTTHPTRAPGVVVALEDRPVNESGNVTTPFAVVEIEAGGGERRRVARQSGSLEVGDEVVVVAPFGRMRFGVPGEARGGAIASGLFGLFPLSAAVFFLGGALAGERSRRDRTRDEAASRVTPVANATMLVAMLAGGLVASSGAPVSHAILAAFGGVSLGLWLHVADGVRMRRDPRWTLGMAVLALNFSAFVAALWLLTEAGAPG